MEGDGQPVGHERQRTGAGERGQGGAEQGTDSDADEDAEQHHDEANAQREDRQRGDLRREHLRPAHAARERETKRAKAEFTADHGARQDGEENHAHEGGVATGELDGSWEGDGVANRAGLLVANLLLLLRGERLALDLIAAGRSSAAGLAGGARRRGAVLALYGRVLGDDVAQDDEADDKYEEAEQDASQDLAHDAAPCRE